MYYKEMGGLKVSALGMGNMRLPKIEGENEKIDRERAQEIIDYAMSHGINYYDTAYRYHGGESELFIGEALKKYPRESFCLASKFPGHMMVKRKTASSASPQDSPAGRIRRSRAFLRNSSGNAR